MAASDHLQPRQFFHGSPEHFEPGDTIVPGSTIGKQTRGDSLPGKVYVTPYLHTAQNYAWRYHTEGPDIGKLADTPEKGPSGHIYEVEPVGRLLHDKNAPMRGWSYTSREAKVIRKVPRQDWYGR